MSTPICDIMRRAVLVAACLALAACDAAGLQGLGRGVKPAPSQIAVTTDRIVVTGPTGFCVDPTTVRDTADTGFVLLGNCAAIANSRSAGQPTTPAVLTATISEPSTGGRISDTIAELDSLFRSDEGRRLLSRSGEPSSIVILETIRSPRVFLLHAADQGAGAMQDVQPDYWRAYLDVGPRLVTLSVLSTKDRSLSREESLSLLRSFVQAVQGAN